MLLFLFICWWLKYSQDPIKIQNQRRQVNSRQVNTQNFGNVIQTINFKIFCLTICEKYMKQLSICQPELVLLFNMLSF